MQPERFAPETATPSPCPSAASCAFSSSENPPLDSRTRVGALLLSSAVTVILYALLFGASSFWNTGGISFLNLTQAGVIAAVLCCAAVVIGGSAGFRTGSFSVAPFLVAATVWLLLDGVTRPFSWFSGLQIRGEILLAGILAVGATIRYRSAPLWIVLGLALVLPTAAFIVYCDGRQLISDDHASFFYRQVLLLKQFPLIPFYNTDWNGGYDARDFFATGALNVLPVFALFSATFGEATGYNLTAAWIGLIFPALCMFGAGFLFTRSTKVAATAAILAAGTGIIWMRWALAYGTLGFCTSTALLPLVAALTWRALEHPQSLATKWRMSAFVAAWTLFFLWPGSMFMIAPIALYVLAQTRSVLTNRRFLICGLLIVLINAPWMILFAKVSQVSSFVSVTQNTEETQQKRAQLGARGISGEISVAKSLKSLREQAGSSNPILLLCIIPGLCLAPRKLRLLLGVTIAYLLMVGVVIAPLKPHLELERLALAGILFAAIPAALAITSLLARISQLRATPTSRPKSASICALAIVPLGMLFSSPFVAASVATNRSILQFAVAGEIWNGVLKTFQDFGSHNGRILFSGFLLHELDGGHAAPLPALAGVPAVASSQFHNLWAYRQVFPKSFLERGDQGIREYLNAMNIGGVFAHEKQWREYFAARPLEFSLERNVGRFAFFRRASFTPSYLYSGTAERIDVAQDRIVLVPTSSEVTLKFIYLPFLASSGCVMKGASIAPELELIKLEECTPGREIVITSVSPLQRLLR